MYDSKIGRWHSLDPLAELYYNGSPYAYVGNNTVNAIDPDGRQIIFISGKNLYSYSPQTGLIDMNTGRQTTISFDSKARQIIQSYNEIYSSGVDELKTQIDVLVNSSNNHYINLNEGGRNSVSTGDKSTRLSQDEEKIKKGVPTSSTTRYDFFDEGKKRFKEIEGVENTNTTTVAHELRHQYDNDQGNLVDSNGKRAKDPAEQRAVRNENLIRKVKHLPIRTTYGGEEIDPDEIR